MGFRLAVLVSGVGIMYAALVFNVYNLQIEKRDYYFEKAEAQYRSDGYLEARRGAIFIKDKNNNLIPAAINKKYPAIYAVPKEIKEKEETAKIVSELLNLDFQETLYKLSKPDDLYELLLIKASAEQVEAVRQTEENLAGIYIRSEEHRFYPFGSLASQVLGFVGENDQDELLKGRYGIESRFESLLAGKPGSINGDKVKEPVNGQDLVLTIDRNIQATAEKILKNLAEKFGADGGSAIVQQPKTGKLLALANYPDFDPNNYPNYPLKNYLNPAVESIYEPGSVFKAITMAAGLDSGKITPETTYYDNGAITLDGRTITNWDFEKVGSYGQTSMTEIIEHSINTGAVFVQRKLGQDLFYNYLRDFGFEEKTGVELPNELAGNLNNLKKSFREINFATAAFGQGVAVTPMELISAASALANGGILMRPYIIADVQPEAVRKVVSEKAALDTALMMASAVKKAGVAYIPKYRIAGKTGTAQVPDFVRGGYSKEVINSYVGFGPISDPQFTILIKLDKPKGAPLAGQTVVPAFKELAQFILNYYNIPPDDLGEKLENRN